ncbi:hypothetical protein [Bradyrhizobium algeriense]|uniref:hypothetical protein n=1 Tax=Bradyrhizobium algeriense TaxID=634784 RepID=UPI00167E6A21|nr:hypothetical protein [Bradyrhizobium algeriense]
MLTTMPRLPDAGFFGIENRWLRDPANDPSCCFPVSCCSFHRAQMHRPAVFARMTTIPESGIIAR